MLFLVRGSILCAGGVYRPAPPLRGLIARVLHVVALLDNLSTASSTAQSTCKSCILCVALHVCTGLACIAVLCTSWCNTYLGTIRILSVHCSLPVVKLTSCLDIGKHAACAPLWLWLCFEPSCFLHGIPASIPPCIRSTCIRSPRRIFSSLASWSFSEISSSSRRSNLCQHDLRFGNCWR